MDAQTFWILVIGVWVLLFAFAGLGGAVARAFGRDPLIGVLLGFFMGPVGIILVAMGGRPPARR